MIAINNTLVIVMTLITSSAALALVPILIHRMRKQQRQLNQISERINDLTKEIKVLFNADLGFGKWFRLIQERFDRLETRQEELEVNKENQSAYSQAVKLLEVGTDINDIIDTCQLSRPEAELLQNLYAYQQLSKENLKTLQS